MKEFTAIALQGDKFNMAFEGNKVFLKSNNYLIKEVLVNLIREASKRYNKIIEIKEREKWHIIVFKDDPDTAENEETNFNDILEQIKKQGLSIIDIK